MGPIKSSQRHSAQYWFCFLVNVESCNTSYKDPYDVAIGGSSVPRPAGAL